MANDVVNGKIVALGEKAQVLFTRGDNSHISAGCVLAEAKALIQAQDPNDRQYTWPEFLAKYSTVGKGQANRLIAYSNGTRLKADDDEARNNRRSSKRSGTPDQSEPDLDENECTENTPAEQKEFFLFTARQSIDHAEFDGIPDNEIRRAARQVLDVWTKFVTQLEKR
jgi:hypothetical protein